MSKVFIPVDEKYRQKHYPNGYLAAMVKSGKGSGIVVIICGLILILVGILMAAFALGILIVDKELGAAIGFFGFAAIIIYPGIWFIKLITARGKSGADRLIKNFAVVSKYPESTIRDFDSQALESDSCKLKFVMEGMLTRDYIFFYVNDFSSVVIKIEDIIGAYLTCVPGKSTNGYGTKEMSAASIEIFSRNKTNSYCIVGANNVNNAEKLLAMLIEKNPAIDTAGGKWLHKDEYNALIKQYVQDGYNVFYV